MPDWIFWIFAGWFVFAVAGRRQGIHGGGCGARHRLSRDRSNALPAEASGASGGRPFPKPASAPPRPLNPREVEASLRDQYVSGEISVERYEEELDRLYRQR